jgi:2-keto-4-pentenoate hydratase/2-oxohepta-3-ene-1,7-dioic acid hydratase in catechol pathway
MTDWNYCKWLEHLFKHRIIGKLPNGPDKPMSSSVIRRQLFTNSSTKMSIQRLVRFVSKDDGKTYYGAADEAFQFARPLQAGSPFSPTTKIGDSKHSIQKLLCPIDIDHARSVVCIGLNYTDHAEEAKMAIPKVPVVL